MSTVEIDTGRYVKRFAFWNPATWSIPKLYWDAWSQEQRLHAICRQLEKVIKYADYLGVNTDDIAARLKAIEEGQLDPIIEAAIEAWFEEHAEDITQRITQLEDVLPVSEFSAENTVKDAIDALGSAVMDLSDALPISEFDSENTVKDAIDRNSDEIQAVDDNLYSEINFKCIDRFIAGDFGTTGNSAGQAGVVFEQENVKYWAQLVFDTNNSANDRLVIRNLSNGATTCDETMDLSHCYSINYNPTKKELVTHHYENKRLIFIDVSNVYAPVIDRTINYAPTGIDNPITCWVGDNIGMLEWAAKRFTIIDETLQTVETFTFDFDNSAVPQNINYDSASNNYYIGCSFPNCVIEIDAETKQQTNVFPVQDFYGCIYMRELESANRLDDVVYINNFENVDDFLVISLLETDLKHGTVTSDVLPYIQPTGNVGCNIDYENGTLIPSDANRYFKLAGDAIKWAQSVNAYGMIYLNFHTDYPHQIHAIGAEIAIASANSDGVTIHAVAVERGVIRITPANLSIIPDFTYSGTVHGAIYLLDSDGFIDGNDFFDLSNAGSYTGACHIAFAASKFNALRVTSAYTVNLVNSILYANVAATVTKQTNYRSCTITSN